MDILRTNPPASDPSSKTVAERIGTLLRSNHPRIVRQYLRQSGLHGFTYAFTGVNRAGRRVGSQGPRERSRRLRQLARIQERTSVQKPITEPEIEDEGQDERQTTPIS